MCELLTDDGRWIDKELKVLYKSMEDESAGTLYLIDPDNQYLAEDNNQHQIISEQSEMPISMRKESAFASDPNKKGVDPLAKLSNDVYRQTFKEKQVQIMRNVQVDSNMNKFIWIISIVCGTFLIIAGMIYIPRMMA